MAQLIACRNSHGIVLAADSKAIDFELDGKMIELKVDRVVQLGPSAAILSGGTAEGTSMSNALKNFVNEEKLEDVQDIYSAALPFLGGEFEKFMRKRCEVLPLDPVHNVYFILAGQTTRDPQNPFRLYLLWTKKKLPQLDGDEINLAYSVPRRMGLEYSLNQLCRENAPLDTMLGKIKEGMEKLGEKQDEVGPPFAYAILSKEGFKKIT